MAIENHVRKYRKSHHDTQQDLAAACRGVNEKTIRNIEITDNCSLEVAGYFHITVNELFSVSD